MGLFGPTARERELELLHRINQITIKSQKHLIEMLEGELKRCRKEQDEEFEETRIKARALIKKMRNES